MESRAKFNPESIQMSDASENVPRHRPKKPLHRVKRCFNLQALVDHSIFNNESKMTRSAEESVISSHHYLKKSM